ncbi:MAG TPA: hypothetical protein VFZ75_08815 [Actinomycetota bacterium]|nr:hypothetical protein [Actinomycetota bacterium]
MRKRLLVSLTTVAIAVGVLSAVPASAAYGITIALPGGNSEFYSPFGGPATITFTFDGADPDATFEARLRPVGGTKVASKQILIDPDNQASPRAVSFSWPALSVTSDRAYQVVIYRNDVLQASESFLLRRPLVKVTGAAPNPFFPWIDDGYKDTTNVKFSLQAAADAEARVYRATTSGGCCGPLILDESIGHRPSGSNSWVWDGQGEGSRGTAGNRPRGNYFVRIWADDGEIAPAVSKPFKVTIARNYRATATRSKPAPKYHHRSAATPLVIGGNCYVTSEGIVLRIICQGAKVTVYWRWGLNDSQRIERASFVFDTEDATCPPSIRRIRHTKHESSFTEYEDLYGSLGHCRLVTAKITYSFPKSS